MINRFAHSNIPSSEQESKDLLKQPWKISIFTATEKQLKG